MVAIISFHIITFEIKNYHLKIRLISERSILLFNTFFLFGTHLSDT